MTDAPPSGRRRREVLLVGALAAAAALRIGLFSAAFPFFIHVDEHKHVDTVLKYARGYLPRPDTDAFEPATGQLLGTYGSPEYHLAPTDPVPPPPWRREPGAMVAKIQRGERFLGARANKEAYQPPVYYAAAALWLHVGRLFGLEGGRLLYWVRGLGALAMGALVLLTHRFLRQVYPGNDFVCMGVLALLVVFPQDALYYVTRDALSPLLGAAAFFLAVRVARRPDAGAALYAATGGVTALACLAKYPNVVLLAVCALASACVLRSRAGAPTPARWGRLLLLWALALGPIAFWLLRNQLLFGDPTATALKARRLGWEPKPFAEWLDHPLFTASGFGAFITGLVPKFWRGELVWQRSLLAWPPADWLYTATTLVFVPLAALGLARRDARASRLTESAALLLLALSVAVLVTLSLLYVFPEVGNPSAARPWFDHGRLIAGALVPFLILYVRGLQVATARLPGRAAGAAAWSGLAAIAAVALLSEVALTRPVFFSAYNAYHLP